MSTTSRKSLFNPNRLRKIMSLEKYIAILQKKKCHAYSVAVSKFKTRDRKKGLARCALTSTSRDISNYILLITFQESP
jgi:hypothetical protein